MTTATDFEKLGVFYLGRPWDLATRTPKPGLVLYDSKDLVTHAVCVGMTGSGKTGLCLALLEEAAIDGIPAIVIDPKGDLANLLLTFPELRPEDFQPWINEDDARKKGLDARRLRAPAGRAVEEGARRVGPGRRAHPAAAGRRGLRHLHAGQRGGDPRLHPQVLRGAAPGDPRRRRALPRAHRRHRDEPARPPRHRRRPDPEPRAHPARDHPRRRVARGARPRPGLAHPGRSRRRPSTRVGVLDLESFYPRQGALRAGDGAQQPARLAGLRRVAGGRAARHRAACSGRPRASRASPIFSIAHLSDAERMFFVSLLLNQVLAGCARSPAPRACARSSTWTRSSATSRPSPIRRPSGRC